VTAVGRGHQIVWHSISDRFAAAARAVKTVPGSGARPGNPCVAFHQEMYDIHMSGATPPAEPGAQRVIVRIVPNAPTPSVVNADGGTVNRRVQQ
jgi:hypothetical protein